MVEIYTDGACSNNGSKENFGGYAFVIVKDKEAKVKYKKGKRNTTNNEMELMGVLSAIKTGKILNERSRQEVIIYSDSAYVVNTINMWMGSWANNNWIKKSDKKPPENLEVIKEIYDLMTFERNIKIHKIKGHSVSEFNAMADLLAVEARKDEEKLYLNELKERAENVKN